ncbi:heavy metal-responsive transcriptional regulator [Bdellovibrio sp.]|uniref:heavy metal-responsive transcriptional regulator n=1 Tax=Bdellovibrio sp. TaxID=28201 RepID=UPI0039E23A4B
MRTMNNAEVTLSIGELSKRSGVSIETIRYYERLGLLKPVARTTSGYRVYDIGSVNTIQFVKRAQSLGFSLAAINDLLKLRATTEAPCNELHGKTVSYLEEIEMEIKKLKNIHFVLSSLVQECRTKKPKDSCSVLDCFEGKGCSSLLLKVFQF